MILTKIISGGQTGADIAALDAAIEYGFPHGGWIPKGRLTENEPLPARYRLEEMPTASFSRRTLQNVLDSDGTLIISRGPLTGGSKLTMEFAVKHAKAHHHIDLYKTPGFLAVSNVYSWIHKAQIGVLNVAGARASKDPEIYEDVRFIVQGVLCLTAVDAPPGAMLMDYSQDQLLAKLPFPPRTVDQAVDQLIRHLDLKSRVKMARMTPAKLLELFSDLFPHFKSAFGRWLDNADLMASCSLVSHRPITNGTDAAAVLMARLWQRLQDTHRIKVVK